MRTRLHALELQKSSFIRHISHELKTPLAAIREGTELLYDNSVGELNAEQQEICHIIKDSVNRLQKLIEDLLDFNIVLDSTSLQDSEKFSFSSVLTPVIKQRKLDIKRKQLTIDCQLLPISLNGNVKQLNVVLDNLLSNAIKYSPNNSKIIIKNQLSDGMMQLSITDNGPGRFFATKFVPSTGSTALSRFKFPPEPNFSPMYSIGALSSSPSPITTSALIES